MFLKFFGVAFRLWLAAAMLLAASVVHAQDGEAPPELDADGLDALARALTPKERSERILDKTFTDAQWQRFETALAANLSACDAGEAAACIAAGRAYERGEGAWIVPEIAEALYKQACTARVGAGCTALARLPSDYLDWEVDSAKYFKKGCDLGDPDACAGLAADWSQSEDPAEIARARAIVTPACEAGGAEACFQLASILMRGDRPEDMRKAAELFTLACSRGSFNACKDRLEAAVAEKTPDDGRISSLMDRVCALGDEQDCVEQGQRAWTGNGTARDPERAIRYLEAACEQHSRFCGAPQALRAIVTKETPCAEGDLAACAALGAGLAELFSPAHDGQRAEDLLERACIAGIAQACKDLAVAVGLFPSGERHEALLRTGCEAGGQEACFKLGTMLRLGAGGGQPDPDAAAALFMPLCDTGYPGACDAESQLVGLAAAARILPADENFLPPLEQGKQAAASAPSRCFTASERFRGKLYIWRNCSRRDAGIGSERARPGAAPWQALIWRPEKFGNLAPSGLERVQCGGSLIAQGWILTAAHCLKDNGYDIARVGHRIRLGVYNPLADEGVSYPILKVIPHPYFGKLAPEKYGFDVALVQYDTKAGLVGKLDTGNLLRRPITAIPLDPIPLQRRKIVAGTPVYVFGWGVRSEQNGSATNYLQVLKIALAGQDVCDKTTGFTGPLDGSAVCAGTKGRQACYGDSGGPLVSYPLGGAPPVLLGVVSAGKKCGETNRVSQYTRVAKVRDWIVQNVPGMR
jgi:TPR repeat protein